MIRKYCSGRQPENLIFGVSGTGGTLMANEKILVVDDDTNICELLRLYLTKEG